MEKYKNDFTASYKKNSSISQSLFRKYDASTSKLSNQNELQRLLELLNATNDVNLQVKLFSALSAYLMFNKGINLNIIIKSSAVYDKIHNVLANGLSKKAAFALNFLSALLYVDLDDDGTSKGRSLAMYAKNMTRISGCLGAMTDLFTDCMMYHDTWKALCQCLTITCSDCELNQSYCTHLIPACIKKCDQTNIDTFLLLQSLVYNHDRNLQLFLEHNGIAIFTRDLLHYDKCLQLLITVVQSAKASSILLSKNKVLDDLRDFLRLYGPDSQIGQKAMIILNHIESRSRAQTNIPRIMHNEKKKSESQEHKIIGKVGNELDDTKTLMQNIMKEIFKHKQDGLGHLKKSASKFEVNSLIRGTSSIILNSERDRVKRNSLKTNKPLDQYERNRLHCNITTKLSFSFLQDLDLEHENTRNNSYYKNINIYQCKSTENIKTMTKNTETQGSTKKKEKDLSYFFGTSEENPTQVCLEEFKPIFSSTPKSNRNSNQTNFSKIPKRISNKTTRSQIPQQRRKIQRRRPKKKPRNVDKQLRNTSLSSRLFSAINESCTTLVKTVANIFKKKEPSCSSKDRTRSQSSHGNDYQNDRSCSYSFLRFMQKRDSPTPRNKDKSDFSIKKSCETCDDTMALKQKLAKNDHLRQTVKKLKLGINLYGCDFKKISRTMWPRESYMTPSVLYNLYRKLLVK